MDFSRGAVADLRMTAGIGAAAVLSAIDLQNEGPDSSHMALNVELQVSPPGRTQRELDGMQSAIRKTVQSLIEQNDGLARDEAFVSDMQNRVLLQRVTSSLRTDENLRFIEHDLREALEKGMRSRSTLDSLESRVLHMRKLLRHNEGDAAGNASQSAGSNDQSSGSATARAGLAGLFIPPTHKTSKIKSAAEIIAEELQDFPDHEDTEPCTKCGKRFLDGFLRRHLEECGGVRVIEDDDDDTASDSDADEDEKDRKGQGLSKTLADLKVDLATKRSGLSQCPVCLRKYPRSRIDKHVDSCQKKQTLANAKMTRDVGVISSEHATVPNAPIKPRHMATTASAIPLAWDPPIYDGGSPVFDYQIEYHKRVEIKVSRRESRFEEHVQPMVSTTRWLFVAPVAHRGFILTGLSADSEYVRIRVRAVNEKGPGPWSDEIPVARTTQAVPPSPPLQFTLAEPPTSTAITLKWEVPMDLGGSTLSQYEIRYSQNISDFMTAIRLGIRDGKKAVSRVERFAAPATRHTIMNLLGNCLFTDFSIIAIASDGQMSPPSNVIPQVRTAAMTREEEIVYELADKRGKPDLEVEVMHAGVHQIMNRTAYIEILEAELAQIRAKKRGSAGDGSDGGDSQQEQQVQTQDSVVLEAEAAQQAAEAGPDPLADEIETRRQQFQYRIAAIQSRIDAIDERSMRLLERRAQLKHVLVAADRRWRVLAAEYDHLKDFNGKQVDSAVMHGRNQRFEVTYLRQLIREELDEVEDTLAVGKKEVLSVIEGAARAKKERHKYEETMKERRGALMAFEKEEVRRKRALHLAARIGKGGMFRCFQSWKMAVARRKEAQRKFITSLIRWGNVGMGRAFDNWWKFVESERKIEKAIAMEEKDALIPGLGSAMLASAFKQRAATVDDVTSLMGWLRSIEDELEGGDAPLADRRGLRAVDTTVLSLRGARKANGADTAAARSANSIVAYGPKSHHTLPLSQTSISKPAPLLKLVDGLTAVLDPTTLAGGASAALMGLEMEETNVLSEYKQADAARHEMKTQGAAAISGTALGPQVDAHIRDMLVRADAYMKAGQFEKSLMAAKQVEMVFGYRKDPHGLLAVYRLLSILLEKVRRYDIALLHWDRCIQLASEPIVNDPMAIAEAREGRGRCLYERAYFPDALAAYEAAEDIYEERNDQPALSRIYKLEAATLHMMRFHEKAEKLEKKAAEMDTKQGYLISRGIQRLRELEMEMIGMGVGESRLVHLEVVGPSVPLLRQQLRYMGVELFKLKAVVRTTKQVVERETRRLGAIEVELNKAEHSAERTMESSVLTGSLHVYEIMELRIALRAEAQKVGRLVIEAEKEFKALTMRITNMEEEMKGHEEYLRAETRDLARLAYSKRPLRAVALNMSNWRTNHVLGAATGGVPKFAAAIDQQSLVYSTLDGEMLSSFVGDIEGNPMGKPVGHTKHITCVAYYGDTVYTGSSDCTVRAWSAEVDRGWGKHTPVEAAAEAEEKAYLDAQLVDDEPDENGKPKLKKALVRDPEEIRRRKAGEVCVMRGHEGTVVCIACNHRVVVSGGADKMVMVWHPRDGRMLRRLRGHELSVTSIAIDDSMFASGSADREVRLWEIKEFTKKNPAKIVEQVRKYRGHTAAVTCIAIAGREVVSGAANGEIIVWDFESTAPLRKHQVHDVGRTVYAIQFDSVKIVSAAADNKLVLTDIISGEPLQTTLKPHGDSHVLALGFDTERLLTVSADRTMRHWTFKGAEPMPVLKLHIIRPGENLASIARRYACKMRDLMRWNSLDDSRKFYQGMRILVAPPPGSEAYEEMLKEQQQEAERQEAELMKAASALPDSGEGAGPGAETDKMLADVIASGKQSGGFTAALSATPRDVGTGIGGSRTMSTVFSMGTGEAAKLAAMASAAGYRAMSLTNLAQADISSMPSTYMDQSFKKVAASTNVFSAGSRPGSALVGKGPHAGTAAAGAAAAGSGGLDSTLPIARKSSLTNNNINVRGSRYFTAPGDDAALAAAAGSAAQAGKSSLIGSIPKPQDRTEFTAKQLEAMAAEESHDTVTVAQIANIPSIHMLSTKAFNRQASALSMHTQASVKSLLGADAQTLRAGGLHPAKRVSLGVAVSSAGGTSAGSGFVGHQRTLRGMALGAAGLRSDAVQPDATLSAHVAQLSSTLPPELS